MEFRRILPVAYCAVAFVAWLNFMLLPPDGLANLGLMLVVFPVTLIDLALRPTRLFCQSPEALVHRPIPWERPKVTLVPH